MQGQPDMQRYLTEAAQGRFSAQGVLQMKRLKRTGFSGETVVIIWIIFGGIAAFFWLLSHTNGQDVRFNNEKSFPVTEGWTAETKDGQIKVRLPVKVESRAGEKAVFSCILKEQERFCNGLMFRSSHQFVRVFLEEELLYEYGRQNVDSIHKTPGSAWQFVRLPVDYAGKKLKIELVSVYDAQAGMMSEVWLGTKNSLVFDVINRAMPAIGLNFPIVCMGFLMLAMSFFFRDGQSVRKIRSLGLFCIAISAWILLESQITQLFAGSITTSLDLLFLIFDAIPVIGIYFLRSYRELRQSRIMKGLFVASAVNYALSQALYLSGLEGNMDGVWRVHVLLIAVLADFVAVYVNCRRKKEPIEDSSVFMAAFCLGGFGFLDIVTYYLLPLKTDAVFFSRIGLVCFIMLLGCCAVRRETRRKLENVEKEVLEKLAYTDMMTGLENRTAFEEKMAYFRKEKRTENLYILVADLNGLKYINDHFGHSMGDLAIKRMGELLVQYFGSLSNCYRIGGDEFCVIAEGTVSETEFGKRASGFSEAMKHTSLAEGVSFQAAIGWVGVSDAGIDRAFIDADERMYAQKARMRAVTEGSVTSQP